MRRKSALIGLALAGVMASGLAASAGTSPNLYYDLGPAVPQNSVVTTAAVTTVANTAPAAEAPNLYYDL